MRSIRQKHRRTGFTLIELLVVVLILGLLVALALPSFVGAIRDSRRGMANANALALAKAVEAKALNTGSYDTTIADYAADLGGILPMNPCTGTNTGYTVTASANSATVAAFTGTMCGTWTPTTFALSR